MLSNKHLIIQCDQCPSERLELLKGIASKPLPVRANFRAVTVR